MIDDGDCGEIGGKKFGRVTEVLRENFYKHHFDHHKTGATRPVFEPGPPRGNCMSYDVGLDGV
jgi:hypothetical protein